MGSKILKGLANFGLGFGAVFLVAFAVALLVSAISGAWDLALVIFFGSVPLGFVVGLIGFIVGLFKKTTGAIIVPQKDTTSGKWANITISVVGILLFIQFLPNLKMVLFRMLNITPSYPKVTEQQINKCSSSSNKDSCLFSLANQNHDSTPCADISDQEMKDNCIGYTAGNLSECSNISEIYRPNCVTSVAVKNRKYAICANLSDTEKSDRCYDTYNSNVGEKSQGACYQIKDVNRQNDCLKFTAP